MNRFNLFFVAVIFIFISCESKKTLPVLGNYTVENGDTIFTQIPEFSLMNQDSQIIGKDQLDQKAHIAAFFFTSCPTICPKVMRSMIRLEEKFRNDKRLIYLCFSLDFKKDSIPRIKDYRNKLGIENPDFHILQGNQPSDIRVLVNQYMSMAVDDPEAPGGINHTGWILLVDKDRRLRSYGLGTDDKDIDRFMLDVQQLLDEMENR